MLNDLINAFRSLRRTPVFTIAAIATLTLGIGANTAIFSVFRAVLLRPLPYSQPESLVSVAQSDLKTTRGVTSSFGTLEEWRKRSTQFAALKAYRDWGQTMTGQGDAELVRGLRVEAGFFETLGVTMRLGRDFTREEDTPSTRWSVILSNSFWRSRFGADEGVIGKSIQLGEKQFRIAGVLPASYQPLGLRYSTDPDVYAPLGYDNTLPHACRSCQHLRVIGRVKPGVSIQAAEAELSSFAGDLSREYPKDYPPDARAAVQPLAAYFVGSTDRTLKVLLGGVGLLLLIACANVASLLLARSTERRRELAVRAALGASRWRLARQLLAESLLLAVVGGAAGLLLATWGIGILREFGQSRFPRFEEISLDPQILLFTALATLACGVLFGLTPALDASRVDLNDALKEAARGSDGRRTRHTRRVLVAAEISIACVMAITTGLLLKSMMRLLDQNPGFDPRAVATMSVSVGGPNFRTAPQVAEFNRQLFERLKALPTLESAALTSLLPMEGRDRAGFHIRGRAVPEGAVPAVDRYTISPDYLKTMRIPVLRGRSFTAQDGPTTERVALVSETTVAKTWPNEDPIGQYIQLGGRSDTAPWFRIIGVVGDVRQVSLDQQRAMQAYLLDAQNPQSDYYLVARGSGAELAKTISQTIRAFDQNQPVYDIASMEDRVGKTLAERRFAIVLLSLFGALALILALVGVYGLISYQAGLRRRELSIRAALGATAHHLQGLVLGEGARLVAAGLAAGVATSLFTSQLLRSLLFDVKPLDWQVSAAAAASLAGTGLLAAYLPARRASKADPSETLRGD